MIFLIDENMPADFCQAFQQCGYFAHHVSAFGLTNTPDETIVAFARQEGFIVVTHDLDFSRIMATSKEQLPSIVTFRIEALNMDLLENIIRSNFTDYEDLLNEGILLTIDDRRIRFKKLPIN